MKKESIIGIIGIMLILLAFVLDNTQESSPLALLIIAIAGLLLSFKYKLSGSSLLCFSGLAMTVHILLFSSSFWILPGALIILYAGSIGLINWWGNDK